MFQKFVSSKTIFFFISFVNLQNFLQQIYLISELLSNEVVQKKS